MISSISSWQGFSPINNSPEITSRWNQFSPQSEHGYLCIRSTKKEKKPRGHKRNVTTATARRRLRRRLRPNVYVVVAWMFSLSLSLLLMHRKEISWSFWWVAAGAAWKEREDITLVTQARPPCEKRERERKKEEERHISRALLDAPRIWRTFFLYRSNFHFWDTDLKTCNKEQ